MATSKPAAERPATTYGPRFPVPYIDVLLDTHIAIVGHIYVGTDPNDHHFLYFLCHVVNTEQVAGSNCHKDKESNLANSSGKRPHLYFLLLRLVKCASNNSAASHISSEYAVIYNFGISANSEV